MPKNQSIFSPFFVNEDICRARKRKLLIVNFQNYKVLTKSKFASLINEMPQYQNAC